MGFSSLHTPNPGGYRHGTPAFKAGFALPAAALDSGHSGDGWVDVRVPFSAFSVDTAPPTRRTPPRSAAPQPFELSLIKVDASRVERAHRGRRRRAGGGGRGGPAAGGA